MTGTRRPRLLPVLLAGLVAAVAQPAAAAGPVLPLPDDARQELTTLLGPGVVGEALPSAPIDDVAAFFPLQARTRTYQVTSGKDAGTTETLRVQQGQRPNGNPAWRVEMSPTIDGYLRQEPSGDLLMPAISDSGEGLVVVPTPANPFLLQGLQPGESRELSQTVAVNYLDDPSDRDYSGELTTTFTYVGTYQVTVPAGTFPAILIRSRIRGKVGPAHTDDSSYHFFARGVGTVATVTQQDVEAFWIVHIDTSTGKVLSAY